MPFGNQVSLPAMPVGCSLVLLIAHVARGQDLPIDFFVVFFSIAAKIKMAAALLKELQFWNITICVGCWLFGFWCGYFVHVWKPVSFFPIPHYWTRSLELFQAWYTIHISHSDVAWYWESLSGIPILAPGATVVFAAVCKKFLKSHILELMWVGGIFQRMMAGMDF